MLLPIFALKMKHKSLKCTDVCTSATSLATVNTYNEEMPSFKFYYTVN